MIDDPYSYDITEFAKEFTWSILYWNMAESNARWMLSGILGRHTAMHALVADLGSRSLNDAMRSAARGMEDDSLRGHVEHFAKGYDRLCEYRNLYVHGLMSVTFDDTHENSVKKLQGYIMTIKGKGRMKAISQPLPTAEVIQFCSYCKALNSYGEAIKRQLGLSDDTFQKILGTPEPTLDKPEWPAPPKQSIHYIQD